MHCSTTSWDLGGPLPGRDPAARDRFRATAAQLYRSLHPEAELATALRELLPRLAAAGEHGLWAHVQMCLATRELLDDRPEGALERAELGLARIDDREEPGTYLGLLNLRGLVDRMEGRWGRSLEANQMMLLVAEQAQVPGLGLTAATNLACTLLDLGLPDAAVRSLESLGVAAPGANLVGRQQAASTHILALLEADRADEARAVLPRLERLLEEGRRAAEQDPTAALVHAMVAPRLGLGPGATARERAEAGAAALELMLAPLPVFPGLRILGGLEAAQQALALEQPALALQILELVDGVSPRGGLAGWTVRVEELRSQALEQQGRLAEALASHRSALRAERRWRMAGAAALLRQIDALLPAGSDRLRIRELQERNVALRATQGRLARLHQAADEARARAEAAAQARHHYLSCMSHELRTPLHGVLGPVELLRDTALTRHQEHLVDVMERSARLALGVVGDVLDLGRLEAGRVVVERAPFRLAAPVESAVGLLQHRAAAAGIGLRAVLAPGLPEAVWGDEAKVAQVLVNLVTNAVKFTAEGEVVVRAARGRGGLNYTVQDTGPGIENDDLETIFDPYLQARARPRGVEGSGLGLPICRGLAEAMGGRLQAQSAVGEGSTFTLWLPLEAAPAPVSAPDPAHDLHGLRVLVAEDNPVNQLVLRMTLEALGAQPVVVGDGRAAVERAEEGSLDVVLLDLQMPVMDGLEACRELARRGSGLPVVGLTASAMPEDEAAARAAGMHAFATKPVDRRSLAEVIRRAIAAQGAVGQTPG